MRYHITAFFLGYILDLLIGDPWNIPHPIRWIGNFISRLDHKFMDPVMESLDGKEREESLEAAARNPKRETALGVLTVLLVLVVTTVITGSVLFFSYWVHPVFGVVIETILTCYILAARSLEKESMKVYDALTEGSLADARNAVSMIVGRDTAHLNEDGVARAAVETVAENTSDGVIAPLLYTCIGGPMLGMIYKAINTMDSMIGYHNPRYEYFGSTAAQLDDIVNFLPARISAIVMIVAASLMGKEYSGVNAWRIFWRDRFHHKSPNSAQTESVCAGALGLRLAGDASYFGKIVHKPYIGDAIKAIEPADIPRSCRLMLVTELLVVLLCMFCMLTLLFD